MSVRCWLLALFGLVLAACGPATTPTPQVIVQTQVVAGTPQTVVVTVTPPPALATQPPLPTASPPATQAPLPTTAALTPTAPAEERVVEVEWPPRMRLGDSDVIRLALIPSQDGYVVTTEFAEHTTVTSTVAVARPGGYDLSAVARLDGVGFRISPEGEQARGLPLNEAVTWRWTLSPRAPGQQRLSLSLLLRWTPSSGSSHPVRESQAYSRALDVQVHSFFGLTTSQAMMTGVFGLIFGSSLSLAALLYRAPRPRAVLRALNPNPALALEPHPDLTLFPGDRALLQVLFRRYARVVVESEFRSGYSGARTFLALPVRADGRADAHTIVKIGERDSIRREFENYEHFVKDTLPPITARIQEPPVTLPSSGARFSTTDEPPTLRSGGASRRLGVRAKAALRYTFIAEPGRKPVSLREALLADPDPGLLLKLFETFGPNWWMQRHPHTFRLAQEYDRLLPAHYVLESVRGGGGKVLDGRAAPGDARLAVGEIVTLRNLRAVEARQDGRSLSLAGRTAPGQPALRVRWLSLAPPDGAAGCVVATRESLLRDSVSGFDLHGLPDPLARLPALLNENVIGTRSTIHGDLNLENILVGPGGFVWLIDFAQTRDGHPLMDFAHLEAEIIAHVIAPQISLITDYLSLLHSSLIPNSNSLLSTLHSIAARCLFNPSQPREYHLALYMACLGALKYSNLVPRQKHLLYLTAAHLVRSL